MVKSRNRSKKNLGVVLGVWLFLALLLLAALMYGEHDAAGISAIVFIISATCLALLAGLRRAEKRYPHDKAGETPGGKIGILVLLPFYFVLLGVILTRIYGHLYLIFSITTLTAWVAYIIVMIITYSRASQEERQDMPLIAKIVLSFNVLFLMAALYALSLVLVHLGETSKIRDLL